MTAILASLYIKIDDIGSLKITHEASSSRLSREGFSSTIWGPTISGILLDQRIRFSSKAFRLTSFLASSIWSARPECFWFGVTNAIDECKCLSLYQFRKSATQYFASSMVAKNYGYDFMLSHPVINFRKGDAEVFHRCWQHCQDYSRDGRWVLSICLQG